MKPISEYMRMAERGPAAAIESVNGIAIDAAGEASVTITIVAAIRTGAVGHSRAGLPSSDGLPQEHVRVPHPSAPGKSGILAAGVDACPAHSACESVETECERGPASHIIKMPRSFALERNGEHVSS